MLGSGTCTPTCEAYKIQPSLSAKLELDARFDSIFTTRTTFETLNQTLKRLHKNKSELLLVLERPDVPLHTNGSEGDIRDYVKKRKVSGGTRSDLGRRCRDTFASLKKTCRKQGISFWLYPQRPSVTNQRHPAATRPHPPASIRLGVARAGPALPRVIENLQVFDAFVEASPVSVMARGLAERLLDARKLDAWFENVDTTQYTRDLPFSAVFSLMSQVVCGSQKSLNAAYQSAKEEVPTSIVSVYSKLKGMRGRDLGGSWCATRRVKRRG